MDEQEKETLGQEVLLGEGKRRGRREKSQSQGGEGELLQQRSGGERGGRRGGGGQHRIQEEMLERWEVNLERVLQVPREEDSSGGREGAAVKNAAK